MNTKKYEEPVMEIQRLEKEVDIVTISYESGNGTDAGL